MQIQLEKSLMKIAPVFLGKQECIDFVFSGKQECEEFIFPIECDDGWFLILKTQLEKIENINKNHKGIFVRADQIKEKFGVLNIYYHIDTNLDEIDSSIYEEVDKIVDESEEMSWKTCERCGRPATKTTEGWITRLCDKCFEGRKNGIF